MLLDMNFTKQIIINAPAEKVWAVAGRDFAKIGVWATAVSHSVANDKLTSVNGSAVGGRLCETAFGTASEEFTAYDDAKKTYSFKGVFDSKMFNDVTSNMEVTSIDDNTAKVEITPALELTLTGVLMYPMIRMQLSKVTDEVLEDLKYYVENGKPSPRKIASQQKQQKVPQN